MATQEIDKLQIDIEVAKLDDEVIKRIKSLATNLEKLSNVLQTDAFDKLKSLGIKLDSKNFEKQLKNIENNAKKISDKIQKNLDIKNTKVDVGNNSNLPKPIQNNYVDETKENNSREIFGLIEYKKELRELKKNILENIETYKQFQIIKQNASLSGLNALKENNNEFTKAREYIEAEYTTIRENSLKQASVFDKLKSKLKDLIKHFKKTKESAEKSAGKGGKSGISTFISALKRIALYRSVRTIVSSITNAFSEGISNVASYDKELNKTLSNLTTAFTNVKNSLGLMVQPIIDVIAPTIQQVSNAFVEIGNAISKATAQMKGLSTYTKISADYMEKYNKSASSSRFSFDTFESLDSSDSTSAMFETADIDNQNDGISTTLELVETIGEWIETIMEYVNLLGKAIKTIVEPLIPAVKTLFEILNQIFDFLMPVIDDIIESLSPVFDAVGVLLNSLLEAVSSILEPIVAILNVVWAILEPIIEAVCDILAPIIEIIAMTIDTIMLFLQPILDEITFISELIEPIVSAIMELVVQGNALSIIFDYIKDVIGVWQTFFQSIIKLFKGDFTGAVEDFKETFVKVWETIKNVGVNVFEKIKDLWESFTNIFDKIKEAGKTMWDAIKSVGAGVAQGLVNGLLSGINYIIKAINKMTSALSSVWDWTGIPSIPDIPTISWKLDIDSFANGGVVGEIWQMNEFGNPEMLFNSRNSGNTSVINQAQLGEAFTQAIINSGLLDAVENSGSITLDGKDIAQSRRFKAEMNRTNPKLNLR